MALERIPADIRKQGGVARMTDPKVPLFYVSLNQGESLGLILYSNLLILTKE